MKSHKKFNYIDNGPYNNSHGFPTIFFLYNSFSKVKFIETKQIYILSHKYRTICIDICKINNNHHHNQSLIDLNEMTNKLINIADTLNIKKFVICSEAETSPIALDAGAKHNERVCGIILIRACFEDQKKEEAKTLQRIVQPVLLIYKENDNDSISGETYATIKYPRIIIIPSDDSQNEKSLINNAIKYWLNDYFC